MKADIHYRAFDTHEDFTILDLDPDEEHAMLEDIFARLNRGSPKEDPWALENRRSLSTGDFVTLYPDGVARTWRCDSFGWSLYPEGVPV